VRGKLTPDTLSQIARRRGHREETRQDAVRRAEAHRLAVTIRALEQALRANKRQLRELVESLAPGLTSCRGVGPVSAGHAIVAFSHPGRIHSEAAYAMLAGAAPIPASSGRTVRHRLNRGGDRRLNAALHTIAVTRMRDCPTTRAYLARRRAQGLTDREIRRCLKRYIARQLYRRLTAVMTPPAA
jgi:transposase